MDNKKQVVSMRMSSPDLGKVREIAKRLRVRESEVYRFAIKNTLAKLAPLYDDVHGRDLVPIFIEFYSELASYFDLDSDRLDVLINGNLDNPSKRVDKEDIQLLAMSGMPEHYIFSKLRELANKPVESIGMSSFVRQYLYEKYVNTNAEANKPDQG